MNRRRYLHGSAAVFTGAAAGCLERSADDGVEGPVGRIDPIGHYLGEDTPVYTYGDVDPTGTLGVVGSFPTEESPIGSSLFSLEDPGDIDELHRLEATAPGTTSNDVKFDLRRDGLYYRTQEGEREGFEIVDFGWEDGSVDSPTVIATVERPDVGVHKLAPHPDEPIVYIVDVSAETDVGVVAVDVSDPRNPTVVDAVGPPGGCHDVTVDTHRELLHAAYIFPPNDGYVIYDLSDPFRPNLRSRLEYADLPEYTEIGVPGFEQCHQAFPETERDIVILGDEKRSGVPGGKHLIDIGWDDGSIDAPEPIGFTHSPDAREMADDEPFWWTTHFHDVVYDDSKTVMVDGGYRQGVWVCDITDPREPEPTERYATVSERERAPVHSADFPVPSTPPFTWGAKYSEVGEFVFVTDSITGMYTFDVSAEPARGDDGGGASNHFDIGEVLRDEPEE